MKGERATRCPHSRLWNDFDSFRWGASDREEMAHSSGGQVTVPEPSTPEEARDVLTSYLKAATRVHKGAQRLPADEHPIDAD
jgi:hypothetical protein